MAETLVQATRRQLIKVQRIRTSRPAGADALALGALLALPVLFYCVPAIFGGVVQPGDNYDQNYPLRILVGQLLQHGTWPLLDPYNWSGSPLLGGWNAGAAYPFTALFAILPHAMAWVLNQLIIYWTAGLGLYAYLRNKRLVPVAALLGAIAFTVGGTFRIQIEHLGLVAGVSWLPLMLLALDKLAEFDRPLRSRVHWGVLLGVCGAMSILSGEPRAVAINVIVLAVYAVWALIRSKGRRSLLLSLVGAAVLAVLLGAVQLLPGLAVVGDSQRAAGGYGLFTAGSLQSRWLALLVSPLLLGGRGSLGQPNYLAEYNLPEVASYIGLLPLVGAFALLAGLRRRGPVPSWLIWFLMALVGIVTALGGETPIGHLLYHIPLFGGQRLQSRNIMITDLSLAVLFGYWVHEWCGRERNTRPLRDRATRWGLIPILLALALGASALIWRADFATLLGAESTRAHLAGRLWPSYVIFLGVALLVLAVVVLGSRWRRRTRAGALIVVAGIDLLLFVALAAQSLWVAGSSPSPSVTVAGQGVRTVPLQMPVSQIGKDGRFLVYGPEGIGSFALGGVGDPDLNVLSRSYSMQGYSATVDAHYADSTGTHKASGEGHNTVSLQAVADGRLDQLSAKYLFVQPRYLMSRTDGVTAPRKSDAARSVGDAPVTWNFGELLRLRHISVSVPDDTKGLQLGLVSADGATTWSAAKIRSGTVHADFAEPVGAVALRARIANGSISMGWPKVGLADGRSFAINGGLQGALSVRKWAFRGNIDGYAVFLNPTAGPALSVRSGDSSATVRRISGDRLLPESAAVSSESGATVLRSVAAISGWKATWQPSGSDDTTSLPVHRDGLIQAVDVPSGEGTLRWNYRPAGWHSGLAATGLGLLFLIAYGGWAGVGAFRRRS